MVTAASDTQLVVAVPAGVGSGPVTITVNGLSATGPYFSTANVSTLAGGSSGTADGQGTNAQFGYPTSIAIDKNGNLFVADAQNGNIREITSSGDVTNFVGDPDGYNQIYADGMGANARFGYIQDLKFDNSGNLIVTDGGNRAIR